MGKKASITTKSTKTPVTVYRMFLKFSMVFAILALFLLLSGKTVVESATPIIVAVICAAAYALCYYFYKVRGKTDSERPGFQIKILLRFVCFAIGIFLTIFGSRKVLSGSKEAGILLCLCGIIACQCLHNNKSLLSHLSTFFANFSTGLVVISLLMMYSDITNFIYLAVLAASAVCVVLSEIFYRIYSDIKHGGSNGKEKHPIYIIIGIKKKISKIIKKLLGQGDSDRDFKKREIVTRMVTEQVLKNVLLVVSIILIWALLVATESIAVIFESNTYEKVTKLLPICISLTTVSVLIWNNFIKPPKEGHLSFDLKPDKEDFRKQLRITFGDNSKAVNAFDYVTDHMARENGYSRWNGDNYYVHPIAVANILLEYTDDPSDDEIAAALLHDCAEDLIRAGNSDFTYSEADFREYTVLKYGSKASVTKKAKSKKGKISNEPTDDAAKTLKFNWYEEESKRQEEYFRYLKADFGDKVAETVKLVTKGYDKNGAPINYKEDANMDAYLKNISDAESASAAKIKIADRMNNNSTLTVCTDEKKKSKTLETHTYYLPFARKVSDKDRKNVSFYEKAAKFFEQEIV